MKVENGVGMWLILEINIINPYDKKGCLSVGEFIHLQNGLTD